MTAYKFWVGNIHYEGDVVDETSTHWIIIDRKIGKIEIPKTAVRKEVKK